MCTGYAEDMQRTCNNRDTVTSELWVEPSLERLGHSESREKNKKLKNKKNKKIKKCRKQKESKSQTPLVKPWNIHLTRQTNPVRFRSIWQSKQPVGLEWGVMIIIAHCMPCVGLFLLHIPPMLSLPTPQHHPSYPTTTRQSYLNKLAPSSKGISPSHRITATTTTTTTTYVLHTYKGMNHPPALAQIHASLVQSYLYHTYVLHLRYVSCDTSEPL